ncbi:MAG: protein-disulfide reductase DsbD domain-containing protein, partial [Methylorubrum rhodinum]|uniref:protein-disulfide reductase DsbD domain-containing protein n=1 Tax=Methylorubrum rhodinum TaxID=29428 RepID=UPI003BAF88E2
MLRLLLLVLLLAAPGLAAAQAGKAPKDLVRARLVSEAATLAPGQTVTLGLELAMKPGWHVYWRNPGDSGLPPEMAWRLPEGFSVGATQWPAPERIPVQTLMNYGYEGKVTLLVPLQAPQNLSTGGTVPLAGTLSYLVCEEICIPGSAELALDLPVGATTETDPAQARFFARARAALPEPAPFPVRATREGETLALHLDRPAGAPALANAAFFPYAESALDNAAEQTLEGEGGAQRLVLRPGDAKVAPDALGGVLTVDEGGTRKAYAIGPEPAAVPATT